MPAKQKLTKLLTNNSSRPRYLKRSGYKSLQQCQHIKEIQTEMGKLIRSYDYIFSFKLIKPYNISKNTALFRPLQKTQFPQEYQR